MTKSTINKKLIIPALLAIIVYLIAFWLPPLLVTNREIIVTSKLDDLIPLFTPAVVIYCLAFFQWLIAIYIILKQETELGYRIFSTITISSIIGMLIFIIFPARIIRPTIEIKNAFDWLLNLMYSCDNGFIFPSFHCLCSWFTVRALNKCQGVSKIYYIINVIFSFLVFASTLLVKQHVIYDVIAGILLCELGFLISKKYTFTKLYDFLNNEI